MPKLTKEQREEIIELRKQGKSVKEICAGYGVTRDYVYKLVNGVVYEGVCRYCGRKVTNNGTICTLCCHKRPYVRELLALANLIKKKAGR